jgi:uncharacterized membrane protein
VITVRTSARGRQGRAYSGGRYDRDSQEFARLVNLCDAVFAIAMTLLAFKVEAPEDLTTGGDLAPVVPQVLAFLLSFGIVANFWWHHHHLLARVGGIESGFVALNLALLGAVALVPFPTELIGHQPVEPVTALVYLGLMLAITVLIVGIVHRAERVGLWRSEVSEAERRELYVGWVTMVGVIVLAMLVAVMWPVVGLALLLLTGPADHLARRAATRGSGQSR